MTITKITLENYKSHAETTLALDAMTVLVGPNGCGKTSVLEAIGALCGLPQQRSDALFDGANAPRAFDDRFVRAGATAWSAALEGEGPEGTWRLKYGASPEEGRGRFVAWRLGERAGQTNGDGHWLKPLQALWGDLPLAARVPRAFFLRLSLSQLARPSTLEVSEHLPDLTPDGQGLPAMLGWMKLAHPTQFAKVVDTLRGVVPQVRGLALRPTTFVERRTYWEGGEPEERRVTLNGLEIVFEMAGGARVPAEAASEGTLMTLGFATMLAVEPLPGVLLIDDIERALHPKGQVALMRSLRAVLAAQPDTRAVVTTHSPFVLDEVEAASVAVMVQRDDGTTATHRLSEHPDARRMLEVLTNGEFLSATGEAWVAQERRDG